MAIGIDFILRGSSASFTKAVASANNSVKDLKKGLKDFDVGNGFKQALGVGGVIAGFRLAITNAQELRDEAEKMGKTLDDGTRSVAKYGDALDEVWKGAKNVATTTLSFFTRAGEGWGMLINRLRGVSREQEKIGETAQKAADRAEESRNRAFAKNQARSETIDKDLADSQHEQEMNGLTTEQKRNKLLEERKKLNEQIASMPLRDEADPNNKVYNVARKEKQIKANKLTGQIKDIDKEREDQAISIMDEMNAASKKAAGIGDSADKLKEVRDKFAPSIEQMANMDVGGFYAKDDPRLKARQILDKESRAAMLGNRGDFKGAIKLGMEAQDMREGLSKVTGSGSALTAQTAEQAFKASLEQTNKELEGVREQLKGLIKAQK